MRRFHVYRRYDPERDAPPRMQVYELKARDDEPMLLDALIRLKAIDPSLSFRRSCCPRARVFVGTARPARSPCNVSKAASSSIHPMADMCSKLAISSTFGAMNPMH